MNTGNKQFIREAFELFKNGFENGFLIENNSISKATFLNVVIIGTLLKEFIWVENFIYEYEKYLDIRFRKNTFNYSLGQFFYEKGDYNSSMQHLIECEYDDISLYLNSKNILIKIYYEEQSFDALESLLSSFTTYLQRKKVMGYHKATYSNIIKLTKKLLKVNPFDKAAKAKLQTEIENTNPLTPSNRKWLLLQVEKLW